MSRPLRYLPTDGALVEVTTRTMQGRFLLRPSEEVNQTFLGVVGRALALHHGIQLHALVVLSNHVHFLLSASDVNELAGFMGYVNGNVAKRIGRIQNWTNAFWQRRFRSIPVLDDEAAVNRLRYLLSHGVKEGLCARPGDWPGINCVAALRDGKTLQGRWHNATAAYEAHRNGRKPDPEEFVTTYEIPLAPLPCWAKLSESERRANVESLINEIEQEAADPSTPVVAPSDDAESSSPEKHVTRAGRAILKSDPHHRPDQERRSPAPACHASTRKRRRQYREGYREFVTNFREGARGLREKVTSLGLVPSAFGPSPGFVPAVCSSY